MRILVLGATGMIGQGVLLTCLEDPGVTEVTALGRSRTGQHHAKLHEVLVPDMADLSSVETQLVNLDACFDCLGVSALGLSEEQYSKLTYDLTIGVARTLIVGNPSMTFTYVSGMGTDTAEKGRVMWARVKGRTENALLAMPFPAAYMFRPGFVQPRPGVRSKTTWYRWIYAATAPLLPFLKRAFPRVITTTDEIGNAMLHVARRGYPKRILESEDIVDASRSTP